MPGLGQHARKVYRFTPPGSGALTLVLSSATDQGISVRTDCADASSENACVDEVLDGSDERLTVDVTGGVPLFVYVHGYSSLNNAGPCTLTLSLTP